MKRATQLKREKMAERWNSVVSAERPLRELVGNLSKVAKSAIDEANSLSLEQVRIEVPRLPKTLSGLRIVHLS
ncbi:MAG: hypothetical protein H0V76_04485, partial [Blastocatellia bacterium]|nr:hypothetical protein [Blastocatellia bacterium]